MVIKDILIQGGKIVTRGGKIVLVPLDISLEDLAKCCCFCCEEIFEKPILGYFNIYSRASRVVPSRQSGIRPYDANGTVNVGEGLCNPGRLNCLCAHHGPLQWFYDPETCIFSAPVTDWCMPGFAIQITCAEDPENACAEGQPPDRDLEGYCWSHIRARIVRASQEGLWMEPLDIVNLQNDYCSCCTCKCSDFLVMSPSFDNNFSQDDILNCCGPCSQELLSPSFFMFFTVHIGRNTFGADCKTCTCTYRCGCGPCSPPFIPLGDPHIDAVGHSFFISDLPNQQDAAVTINCGTCDYNKAVYSLPWFPGSHGIPTSDIYCHHAASVAVAGVFEACQTKVDVYDWVNWEGETSGTQAFESAGCRYKVVSTSHTCNADGTFEYEIELCFVERAIWAEESIDDVCAKCPCYTLHWTSDQPIFFGESEFPLENELEGEELPEEMFNWKDMLEDENGS